ncbi:MaoC/PaaZ C-terminal domain-containing protein [Sporosarcina sp.]|uniref:MaoC/PaaZ C-terminal domain-containing protein n=1 Tax=Sporosarcina sp. TaxID=49982 RepID=UPI0026114963|nr:MaoC/PaaZ C-terminal domain-containing protein [Sporosarcina sp.]
MIKDWVLEELTVDQKLEPMVKPPITKVQIAQYAGASSDFNPLHLDDDFAKKIGLDGVIVHGMLVMAFLGEYVMKIAGNEAWLANFKMRFGKMTVPGDEIRCSGAVARTYEEQGKRCIALELTAEKVSGEIVGAGSAILHLHAIVK